MAFLQHNNEIQRPYILNILMKKLTCIQTSVESQLETLRKGSCGGMSKLRCRFLIALIFILAMINNRVSREDVSASVVITTRHSGDIDRNGIIIILQRRAV